MKKRTICAVLVGIMAISIFTGCSQSEANKAGSRGADTYDMPAVETAAGCLDYAPEYDSEAYFGDSAASSQKSVAADSVSGAPEGGGNGGQTIISPENGRLLIRTVTITAETTNYTIVESDLKDQVSLCGGYIENSSMRGTGKDKSLRTGSYVIRVPADKLDGIIESFSGNCTVTSSAENSTDVTLEYVDTQSRIESLRIEYDQLTELLKNADDLDNIFLLQNRLTEVRYEIESSEQRLRVLQNQVQFATLNLTLTEVLEESVVEEAHVVSYGEKAADEFEQMKENTVEFFQDFGLWLISAIPGLVVMAIIAVIILIIVFSVRKKIRKRRAALATKTSAKKVIEAEKTTEEISKTADEETASDVDKEEK